MTSRAVLTYAIMLLAVAGCSFNSSAVAPSAVHLKAADHLSRGIRAEAMGDVELSERLINQSLEIATSIDDRNGMASALVNRARIARIHRPGSAEPASDIRKALGLLNESSPLFPDAAHENALLLLSSGESEEALNWALRSLKTENPGRISRRQSLVARIHLSRGDSTNAETHAAEALKAARSNGDKNAEATSRFMYGLIFRSSGKLRQAMESFEQALVLDRELGLNRRVCEDLMELSSTADLTGSTESAADYLERAADAMNSGGNHRKAAELYNKLAERAVAAGDPAKEKGFRARQEYAEKAAKPDSGTVDRTDQSQRGEPVTISPSSRP